MSFQLRQLLHDYTTRRSPWGPPWWIYGVAFGAANLVRHVVIIVTPAEIPQSIRVASWIATAFVVIAVINSVAVVLQRRDHGVRLAHAPTFAPIWPLRRPDEPQTRRTTTAPGPSDDPTEQMARPVIERGPSMTNQHLQEQPTTSIEWAPWWVYLVIIVGANFLRRALLPGGSTPALRVAVALGVSAVLFVTITVIYRAATRRGGTPVT